MPKITDDQLANWTKPAFGNEEEKADATEQMIREAIKAHPLLGSLSNKIRVFAKGSFKNNTNVRRDSDVDVAVEYQEMILPDYANGATFASTGLVPYAGVFKDGGVAAYKAAVGQAMRTAFGSAAVDGSGNKVFTVRESTRSLAADVVPCVTYRLYQPSGSYRQGIELILDRPDGKRHHNYPDQHYANGVQKNQDTKMRFKRVVRILKNIENKLVEEGELAAVPSYLMECLAYNVADQAYTGSDEWREIVTTACAVIYGYAKRDEPPTGRWLEVNGHKWLFHPGQRWNRQDARTFAARAFAMVDD